MLTNYTKLKNGLGAFYGILLLPGPARGSLWETIETFGLNKKGHTRLAQMDNVKK